MTQGETTDLNKAMGGHRKDSFIQVWRGIAAFLVIYYHFTDRVTAAALNSPVPPTVQFYTGKLGVMVFFVISGYLITLSLAGSTNLAAFLAKRVSRIWPLFILASLTIFAAMHFLTPPQVLTGPKPFHEGATSIVDLIGNLFFLADLGFRWVDGVFWSILVELKFYLWIGLLAVLAPKRFVAIFATAAFALGTAEMLIRINDVEGLQAVGRLLNGVFIAQHAPFFAIGALMLTDRNRPLLTLNLLLACCEVAYKVSENPDFSVYGTIQFVLLLGAVVAVDAVLFRQKLMLLIGDYSYSWYLFHQLIGLSLIRLWSPQIGIDMAVVGALAVTFALCWLGSQIAEWRFRRPFYTVLMRVFSALRLDRAKIDQSAIRASLAL